MTRYSKAVSTFRAAFMALALCSLSGPAFAVVITFEDLGVAAGTQYDPPDNTVVTSNGFDFINGPLSSIPDLHFPNASGNDIGGTTEMLPHEDVIMTVNGGGTFTLSQFDWGSSFSEAGTFTVHGTLSGGGIVAQAFILDGNVNTFQTFTLGAAFTNLVSVTFEHLGGVQGIQNIDNIVVNATVPEPATLALLAVGLAGLGWGRRKKA